MGKYAEQWEAPTPEKPAAWQCPICKKYVTNSYSWHWLSYDVRVHSCEGGKVAGNSDGQATLLDENWGNVAGENADGAGPSSTEGQEKSCSTYGSNSILSAFNPRGDRGDAEKWT